ncbi:TetR/AcrR family transcriptional regulator [Nocardia sp. alder85J]|uniref:TetR/AcrR family transcriptional regulator n=1 Tax=Nocardia sp. alder85J TaxID=2862949 RepID=UPI001CD316BA|nr:TetR/AcrR family transcriptional regulator [Nocardia sp. alder85J]MCX4097596.1 TetR/AcrR family transcriptional regulator [Nocardia sp. alder85J]
MSDTQMGRPRQFDGELVLEAVTRCFHERGYHATTMSDLLGATGLHKGSLYGAFGDKHSLFVSVLRRYAQQRLVLVDADLGDAVSPLAGIRAYLDRQAREAVMGRGCLLANSALELLPGDDAVEEIILGQHRDVQQRLAQALERAGARGEIPGRRAVEPMARSLFAMIQGLWELGRVADDVTALREIVDGAVRSLGA